MSEEKSGKVLSAKLQCKPPLLFLRVSSEDNLVLKQPAEEPEKRKSHQGVRVRDTAMYSTITLLHYG